jgi:hypothetical protein
VVEKRKIKTHKKDRLGMNSEQYTNEVLERHLKPFWKSLPQKGQYYEVFEDNSSVHGSELVQAWYMDNKIKLSPWPAKSPELKAIENVWSMLKHAVGKRWNREGLPKTSERLITVAKEEWRKLDWAKIYENILLSMSKRVEQIIDNEGKCISY